jgi:hypothetical protein
MKEYGKSSLFLKIVFFTFIGLISLCALQSAYAQTDRKFYAQDDPQAEFKEKIENLMGLYLVDPPRRHPSEIVQWDGQNLHFHLWVPIADQQDGVLIQKALQWLVLGRIRYSSGAQGIFSEYGEVDSISLSFHEVKRKEENSADASSEKLQGYVFLKISRSQFEQLDPQSVRDCSSDPKDSHACGDLIKNNALTLKLDKKYLLKVRQSP